MKIIIIILLIFVILAIILTILFFWKKNKDIKDIQKSLGKCYADDLIKRFGYLRVKEWINSKLSEKILSATDIKASYDKCFS